MARGRSIGTRIGNPNFVAYAESFGIHASRPESIGQLRDALHDAIASRELRLIEVPVDPSVNRALAEKPARYWQARS